MWKMGEQKVLAGVNLNLPLWNCQRVLHTACSHTLHNPMGSRPSRAISASLFTPVSLLFCPTAVAIHEPPCSYGIRNRYHGTMSESATEVLLPGATALSGVHVVVLVHGLLGFPSDFSVFIEKLCAEPHLSEVVLVRLCAVPCLTRTAQPSYFCAFLCLLSPYPRNPVHASSAARIVLQWWYSNLPRPRDNRRETRARGTHKPHARAFSLSLSPAPTRAPCSNKVCQLFRVCVSACLCALVRLRV